MISALRAPAERANALLKRTLKVSIQVTWLILIARGCR